MTSVTLFIGLLLLGQVSSGSEDGAAPAVTDQPLTLPHGGAPAPLKISPEISPEISPGLSPGLSPAAPEEAASPDGEEAELEHVEAEPGGGLYDPYDDRYDPYDELPPPEPRRRAAPPADLDLFSDPPRVELEASGEPGDAQDAGTGGGPAGTPSLGQPEFSQPDVPPARGSEADEADEAGAADAQRQRTTHTSEPAELLSQALSRPHDTQLKGRPLSLHEAIGRRGDRAGRIQVVHAYWNLSQATAEYYWALQERRSLAGLDTPAKAADVPLLNSARSAAEARVHETHAVAIAAQHELHDLLLPSNVADAAGGSLTLTDDAPHVGSYATRFDELFPVGVAPPGTRALHEMLPRLRDSLHHRAEAVNAAAQAVAAAEADYAQGRSGVDAVLARLANLSVQRQSFLNVVRGYNDSIADYALNVAREGITQAELVSMLIRTRQSARPRDAAASGGRVSGDGTAAPGSGGVVAPRSPDGFVPRNRGL